LAKKLVQSK